MEISSIKKGILEVLWEAGEPLHRDNISEKMGLQPRSTMGHLLGLIKAEYVSVARKNYYVITDSGKKVLSLAELDRKQAQKILSSRPLEKAFHFCTGPNQYTGVYAKSLDDFREKILTVDLESLEFHVSRGDFESWFSYLGDDELARTVSLVREKALSGEPLRKELYETVKSRCDELKNLTGLSSQFQ